MGKLTIAQVKENLNDPDLREQELMRYRQDTRKGVQKLIQRYESEKLKKAELEKQYEKMMYFENEQLQNGRKAVAGIDEAGRGPLAGPVVAGAVILPAGYYLEGLNDSKKLSLKKREEFYRQITRDADWSAGIVTNQEIDRLNIFQATKLAMKRAVDRLSSEPDHLLIDAMELDGISCTQTSLIKGDQRSASIAAASVIAKVTRDWMMADLDKKYPAYHFQTNQGYGTKAHLDALSYHGVSPAHRLTFAPVKDMV